MDRGRIKHGQVESPSQGPTRRGGKPKAGMYKKPKQMSLYDRPIKGFAELATRGPSSSREVTSTCSRFGKTGSPGYSERASLIGAESAGKTASGLLPAQFLDKGLGYELARQPGSRWRVPVASATGRDGIASSRVPIRSNHCARSHVLGWNPCKLPCSDMVQIPSPPGRSDGCMLS
jgi:hypothetical protein